MTVCIKYIEEKLPNIKVMGSIKINIPYIPKQLLMKVVIFFLLLFFKNNDTVRLMIAILAILDIAIYAAIPNANIIILSILALGADEYKNDIARLNEASKYIKKEYSKLIDFFIASLGFNI